MNDLTPIKAGEIIEAVIARGDIAQLSPQERAKYYVRVCESVGLNPMTRPFEYITLNGKLTLYARKDCTDQLRAIHGVSVCGLAETERDGVFIVTAAVENSKGRKDAAKGAVSITGLKGEALANALMKAETKAKRRATLSICGLGFLDETEAETIPGAPRGADDASYPEQEPPTPPAIEAQPEPPTEVPGSPAASAAADAHTIEGVVVMGEEGERPATQEDFDPRTLAAEVDPPTPGIDTGIPDFLRREKAPVEPPKPEPAKVDPPKPAKAAKPEKAPEPEFDVAQWLRDLEGAASGCNTLDELVTVQNKVQIPAGKVLRKSNAEAWQKGKDIILAASARIMADASDDDAGVA